MDVGNEDIAGDSMDAEGRVTQEQLPRANIFPPQEETSSEKLIYPK